MKTAFAQNTTTPETLKVLECRIGAQESGLYVGSAQLGKEIYKMSVTVDMGMNTPTGCFWLRFSQTSDALASHLRENGWHLSDVKRHGWHRQADAQSEAFIVALQAKQQSAPKQSSKAKQQSAPVTTPVQVDAPKLTTPATLMTELSNEELLAKYDRCIDMLGVLSAELKRRFILG